MAIDFTKPALADNYSTAFQPAIIANQIALAQWLDSANTTITAGAAQYMKRYNRTTSAIEEYSGSAWAAIKLHGISVDSTGVNVGIGGGAVASMRLGITTPAGNSTNGILMSNGTGRVQLIPAATAGALNTLTQAADAVLMFCAGVAADDASSGLVIGPWSASAKGLRIDNNGNVAIPGIGTGVAFTVGTTATTGSSQMRVLSSTNELWFGQSANTVFSQASGNIGVLVQNGAMPLGIGTIGAQDIIFGTNNTIKARLNSSGYFCLGSSGTQTYYLESRGTATNLFGITSMASGSGTHRLGTFTNQTDADCNVTISQIGATTKGAWIGPSYNIPLNLQSNGTSCAQIATTGMSLLVPLVGMTKASSTGATLDGSLVVNNNGNTGDSDVAAIQFNCNGNYSQKLYLRADGYMGIGGGNGAAWKWYVAPGGDSVATGNVTAYSDERLKTDWGALPHDLVERLADVRAGAYTRIDSGQRQIGVGAQSLRKVIPEAVAVSADGDTLTVSYGNAALAAVVALARKAVGMERRLAALEAA